MTQTPADRLRLSVGRLASTISHWTPPRFAAAASPLLAESACAVVALADPPSAEDLTVAGTLHRVVQALADLDADAEGRPRRPVPVAEQPGTIADQLVVLGNDVAAAGGPRLEELTARLDTLRSHL